MVFMSHVSNLQISGGYKPTNIAGHLLVSHGGVIRFPPLVQDLLGDLATARTLGATLAHAAATTVPVRRSNKQLVKWAKPDVYAWKTLILNVLRLIFYTLWLCVP